MKRFILTIVLSLVAFAIFLPLGLATLATPAHAACIGNWPGSQSAPQQREHKALHLLGSAAITAGTAWATDDVRWGIAAGAAVGLAREVYKARTPGMRCEWSSMTYDAIGVGLGAWGASRWLIVPRHDGVRVAWVGRF